MTKINFVDLEKLWNFLVGNFFIWINLLLQKVIGKSDLRSARNMAHGKRHICIWPKQNQRQKFIFADGKKKAHGKNSYLRTAKKTHGKYGLCRVPKKNTRQTWFLLWVFFSCHLFFLWPSVKMLFAVCPTFSPRQRSRHTSNYGFSVVIVSWDERVVSSPWNLRA